MAPGPDKRLRGVNSRLRIEARVKPRNRARHGCPRVARADHRTQIFIAVVFGNHQTRRAAGAGQFGGTATRDKGQVLRDPRLSQGRHAANLKVAVAFPGGA